MKYVSYSGETVLTTDGVGNAVVEYARALVTERSADVVDIPVVVDHTEGTASMLISSASPLIVVEAVEDDVPLNDVPLKDETAIARMRAKAASLGRHRAWPSESFVIDDDVLLFDYL